MTHTTNDAPVTVEQSRCLTPGCRYSTEIKTHYAHSSYGNARVGVTALFPEWKGLKATTREHLKHIENILHRHMEAAVAEIGQYDLTIGGSIAKDWPLPHRLAALASAPAGKLDRDYTTRKIKELMDEGDGFWRACSGCQEGVDGYVSERDYPFDPMFRCQPGGGCSECGGIGVLWDDGRGYDDITGDQQSAPAGYGDLPDRLPGHWDGSDGAEIARACTRLERSMLCKGGLSDMALANAVYLAGRDDLDLIVWQTAAKERIRWLSARLAAALARPRAAVGEREARQAIERAFSKRSLGSLLADENVILACYDAILALQSPPAKVEEPDPAKTWWSQP